MKTVGRNQVEDAAVLLSHLAIPPSHQWLFGFQDSKHAREHVMAFMLPEILRVDRLGCRSCRGEQGHGTPHPCLLCGSWAAAKG